MSVPFHCHILQFCSYCCLVDKCSTQAVNVVVDAVYSPYVPYLLDYPTLQQTFLTEQLQATRLVGITHGIYNTSWQLIIKSHRSSVRLHSLIDLPICNLGHSWTVMIGSGDCDNGEVIMMMMAIYLGINELPFVSQLVSPKLLFIGVALWLEVVQFFLPKPSFFSTSN